MKELITRLRETASKGVSVWGDLLMEAADAIERLENEALAATIRMDNDAKKLDAITVVNRINEITAERDALRAANLDLVYQFNALREDHLTLQQQEPAAWINGFGGGPANKGIYGWSEHPIGTKFYLAAGAQPKEQGCKYPTCHSVNYQAELVKDLESGRMAVPTGWQIVPIEPTEAMLKKSAEAIRWYEPDVTSRPVYKAMLAAAKEGKP